jgi:ketosteroid isomerase-like protein
VRDDLVVQEWTATATHRHPVTYNDTTLEPTGRTIRWDGMDIIPMRDGQVARKDVYAESLSYLRQLGAPL